MISNGHYHAVATVGLVMLAGCAPKPIVEWDIRTGLETDKDTGFYAYTTALPATDPTDLIIQLTPRDSILGLRIVHIPDEVGIYPAISYKPDHLFVTPDTLREILGDLPTAREITVGKRVVLGYFMKKLSVQSRGYVVRSDPFIELDEESPTKGVGWIRPSSSLRRLIRPKLEAMRQFAASYGGHAMLDVRVFYTSDNRPYGDFGVYVTAKVVVFETE